MTCYRKYDREYNSHNKVIPPHSCISLIKRSIIPLSNSHLQLVKSGTILRSTATSHHISPLWSGTLLSASVYRMKSGAGAQVVGATLNVEHFCTLCSSLFSICSDPTFVDQVAQSHCSSLSVSGGWTIGEYLWRTVCYPRQTSQPSYRRLCSLDSPGNESHRLQKPLSEQPCDLTLQGMARIVSE